MKIPIIILFIFVGILPASAQVERKPAETKSGSGQAIVTEKKMDKQNLKDRLKDLDLTREQKIKLKEIRQTNLAVKASIENNTQLPEPEKKKQMRALQREQAQKVQAILTEEQKAKFKAGNQNNL